VIRVAIAAAPEIERAGLAALLAADPGLSIVETPSAADVLVLAIRGVLDETAIHSAGQTPVLLVIDEDGPVSLAQAFRSGARGVAFRHAGAAALSSAVRAVHAGWAVCPPAGLLTALAPERATSAPLEPLTPRELDVLRMLADGSSNKQIAFELGMSTRSSRNSAPPPAPRLLLSAFAMD
jgi:hypothetical protein